MSYARVETSVRTNRKFLQAGSSASWLWLCGVLYCQESLTDGFIPFEAVKFLGVDNPKPLIPKLVHARLWDEVDGGWMVHDYLQHNKSAESINQIKDTKRRVGKQGGEASGRSRVLKQETKQDVKQTANPLVAVAVAVDASVAEQERDTAFVQFQQAYPEHRRKGGYLVETTFNDAFARVGNRLFAALENHKASEQWQTPKLIPGMDVWLKEERWTQRLDPPKPSWRPEEAAS